jgi:hypothetical protein
MYFKASCTHIYEYITNHERVALQWLTVRNGAWAFEARTTSSDATTTDEVVVAAKACALFPLVGH